MTKLIIRINSLFLLFLPAFSWARSSGLGQVAQNIIEPVSIFSSFVQTGSMVLGASFLLTCIIKYIEHRRSPLMVPLSRVIFLLVAGIVLIILPFLSMLAGSGASNNL